MEITVRRIVILTFLLAAGLVAGRAAASPFPIRIHFPLFHHAGSWTQFRNGPDNNAVIPGNLDVSWRLETRGQISASPSLVDGTLYVGNNDGVLYAIDPTTGRIRWLYRARNPLMSAPIVYQGFVFVGEGDPTSRGSSPSEPIEVGRGESAIIALDAGTGSVRWISRMQGSAMPTPAIVDGILVDHNGAGWVTGFDPSTGHKKFARRLDSMASMTAILPTGRNDFVTAGVGLNAVWRMNAHTGAVVWRSVFSSGSSGIGDCPPVSDGTRIFCDYVAPVSPDRATNVGDPASERVYALDASNGRRVWDVSLESGVLPPRNEAAIPLLAGGSLFVGSAISPFIHAIDPASGKLLWERRVRGPIKGGIVYVDGTIYFGDLGGYLWALDAKTGSVVGDKNMKTPFNVGSPIVDGDTLIVGSNDGSIFAYPLASIRNSRDR